jgi:hypothetical protein
MKITFTKSDSWQDCRGKFTYVDVIGDGEKIGEITGELDCGIGPGMEYKASVKTSIKSGRGGSFVNFHSLKDIKSAIKEEYEGRG